MKRREFLTAGLAATLLPRFSLGGTGHLDTAYLNASVWTGTPGAARSDALGVAGNRIAALGAEAVRAAIGPRTKIVDLGGAFVVPGFIDNHTHFLRASQGLSQADLRLAASREELVEMIAASAGRLADGQWLEGGNWDEQRWGGELPTRHWIDAVTPDTPVAVVRTDQHMMLLNTLALKLAGIDRGTVAPPGGLILRDDDGEPTGIVKDTAMDLVVRVIPEPTAAQIDSAIQAGIEYGLGLGVTQVHIKELDWVTHHSLRRLRARGETGMRFYSYVPLPDWEQLDALVREEGRGDDWVRWGGLKGLVDGSLGSRTALFHEPYTDAPDTRGLTVVELDELRRWIEAGDRHGHQLAVHAIGDEANELLLDMFAATIEKNGKRDRRFLIEHAQHVAPEQIARFGELGVVPSMQPFHAIDDGRWAVKRIGPERLRGTYAFRSLLDAGAELSFGSDWPVAPLNPLTGVEAALRAYTVANAYAGFQDDRLGRLAPGMIADFVVLAEDLFAIDPARLAQVPVRCTVVDGRVRYQA